MPAGRNDIQGLRALAVLVVVAHHLAGRPAGGFVGVDVFFVVSGFLITGLLLREHERTGTISFRSFYGRRVRRLLPAAVLVLAVTVAATGLVLGAARARDTAVDAAWALVFAGNWHAAAEAVDYFRADGPVSPLQHFWSLAVEEQFYVVWPALLAVVLGLAARRTSPARARLALGATVAVLAAASLAWALHVTATAPTAAYFSTAARAWELAAGALLAVGAGACSRLPDGLRPLLSWAGLACIVVSVGWVAPTTAFPAPGALLPVLGTLLVLAAGTHGDPDHQQRWLWPLTNPLSRCVGDLSYALYLWHLPVIVLGVPLVGDGAGALAGLALLSLVLAAATYHLVEDPLRHARWSRPRPRSRSRSRYGLAGAVTTVLVAATATVVALQPGSSGTTPDAAEVAEIRALTAASYSPAVADLQTAVRVALATDDWPDDLSPGVDEAIAQEDVPEDVDRCGQVEHVDVAGCTWGHEDATRRAVVVGDSISLSYVVTLRDTLPDDWSLTALGAFGCAFTDKVRAHPDADVVAGCEHRKELAADAIRELEPDLLVVANMYVPRPVIGKRVPMTPEEWRTSTETEVAPLRSAVGHLAFLAPPPSDVDIADCWSRVASPADCEGRVTASWEAMADAEVALAADLGATYVDSRDWFCADDRCPAFVGTTPVKNDLVHMTQAYQRVIEPAVAERLAELGVYGLSAAPAPPHPSRTPPPPPTDRGRAPAASAS
ncbi:acyltransferase family protein [Nocardioides zeae]|uniref:Peptidoglycan/LPS O-acetylase OafA/YrhL n=1 Tax=Nocardioides zeae TaxID=1457234 RepID=A0AAJ1U6P4_9ACTN|nr:acyltransferase family protein [Nocardioides zeae]MDQ1106243.1 peptidoglycan/LPS O-acetylase OafA/YrhL [Nocardioides zeae]